MGIVCGANKLHVDFYNEMHQNEVMVSGYSVLYVNWLERKLTSAQKKDEVPETIDNNAMFQLLCDIDKYLDETNCDVEPNDPFHNKIKKVISATKT